MRKFNDATIFQSGSLHGCFGDSPVFLSGSTVSRKAGLYEWSNRDTG